MEKMVKRKTAATKAEEVKDRKKEKVVEEEEKNVEEQHRDDDDTEGEIDAEEVMLRSTLFGFRPTQKEQEILARQGREEKDEDEHEEIPDDALFKIDVQGAKVDENDGHQGAKSATATAAWEDPDDENVDVDLSKTNRLRKLRKAADETVISGKEYTERLRGQHEKLYGKDNMKWAQMGVEEGEEDEEEARLKQASSLFSLSKADKKKDKRERAGKLVLTKLKDANYAEYNQSVVLALDFHKRSPELMLTGGMDKTLRLFRVNNKDNSKLQSVHFSDLPIYGAQFSGATHVVLTGRRPFLYSYDVETGSLRKFRGVFGREVERSYEIFAATQESDLVALGCAGGLICLASRSDAFKERMSVKVTTSRASCIQFGGEHTLFAQSADGDVYKWDLRKGSAPLWRRKDLGTMKGTALACSEDMGVYATGDASGIVSLYEDASGEKVRSFESLTTSISSCAFLPGDGRLMAFSSYRKKDYIRLVHIPTNSVVKNWPLDRTPVGRVSSIAFSHQGGLLACGNDKGKVLLWRVQGFE